MIQATTAAPEFTHKDRCLSEFFKYNVLRWPNFSIGPKTLITKLHEKSFASTVARADIPRINVNAQGIHQTSKIKQILTLHHKEKIHQTKFKYYGRK